MPKKRSYRRKTKHTNTSIKKVVMRTLDENSEFKSHEVNQSTLKTAATTGELFDLMQIGEGTDEGERTGLVINRRSVLLRAAFAYPGSSNNFVRVLLFHWAPPSVSVPSDIIDTTEYATNSHIAPLKKATSRRYRIIHDKVYPMAINASSTVRLVHFYARFNVKMKYSDGLESATASRKVYFGVFSSNNINAPQYQFVSRIRYTDG